MHKHIKKISFAILLIAATTSMTFTGCKKKDSSSSSPTTTNTNNGCGDGTLCGKLDGNDFVSDNGSGMGTSATVVSYGTYTGMSVSGSKNSKDVIQVSITQAPQAGQTYSTSKLNAAFSYTNTSTSEMWTTDNTTAHSGTVTITKYDATANLVSGTFSFTAASQNNSSTHSFTNGAFTNVKVSK
jgi:hypothetical protein